VWEFCGIGADEGREFACTATARALRPTSGRLVLYR